MTARASPADRFATLPNAITVSRIAVAPLCVALLAIRTPWALGGALALMALAEITDLLDGMVARATLQISAPGKILDPMADALYRGLVFLAFVFNGWVPLWMMFAIFLRDLIVAYLREFSQSRGRTQGARLSGKIKAIVQAAAQLAIVAVALFWGASGETARLIHLLMLCAVLVTTYSLADYVISILRTAR